MCDDTMMRDDSYGRYAVMYVKRVSKHMYMYTRHVHVHVHVHALIYMCVRKHSSKEALFPL